VALGKIELSWVTNGPARFKKIFIAYKKNNIHTAW
jgi:hypothetical protein